MFITVSSIDLKRKKHMSETRKKCCNSQNSFSVGTEWADVGLGRHTVSSVIDGHLGNAASKFVESWGLVLLIGSSDVNKTTKFNTKTKTKTRNDKTKTDQDKDHGS